MFSLCFNYIIDNPLFAFAIASSLLVIFRDKIRLRFSETQGKYCHIRLAPIFHTGYLPFIKEKLPFLCHAFRIIQ